MFLFSNAVIVFASNVHLKYVKLAQVQLYVHPVKFALIWMKILLIKFINSQLELKKSRLEDQDTLINLKILSPSKIGKLAIKKTVSLRCRRIPCREQTNQRQVIRVINKNPTKRNQ